MRNFLEKNSQILLYWIKTNTVRECMQIRQPWLDLHDIQKDKNRGDKMRFIAIPSFVTFFLHVPSPLPLIPLGPFQTDFCFADTQLKPRFLRYL